MSSDSLLRATCWKARNEDLALRQHAGGVSHTDHEGLLPDRFLRALGSSKTARFRPKRRDVHRFPSISHVFHAILHAFRVQEQLDTALEACL